MSAAEIWSSSTDLTEDFLPVRDSRSAETPSLITKRSVLPARNAARMSSLRKHRRDVSITDVLTIRNAILCPGRDRQTRSALSAEAI